MVNDLTTYQIYLTLLGYLTKQDDDIQILESMLVELYRRANKALDQEPCEDTISREKAIKSAKNIYNSNSEMKAFCMMKMLQELPSIQPVRPKGEWIKQDNTLTCSLCGCQLWDEQTYIPHNFCPNCGADMRGK